MSEKKRLFTHIKPNTCPVCGKDSLWLVEYECTYNKLNDLGFIVLTETEDYKMKLQCSECGAEFPNVSHKGLKYSIKSTLPKVERIMKDYNPFQI